MMTRTVPKRATLSGGHHSGEGTYIPVRLSNASRHYIQQKASHVHTPPHCINTDEGLTTNALRQTNARFCCALPGTKRKYTTDTTEIIHTRQRHRTPQVHATQENATRHTRARYSTQNHTMQKETSNTTQLHEDDAPHLFGIRRKNKN